MGAKKTDQKEYAKVLFLDTNQKLTIKEIAERVGVAARTVSKWIEVENWEKLRKSLMVTRQKLVSDLYTQLEILNDHITTRNIIYDIPDTLLKGTKIKGKDGVEKIVFPTYIPEDYPIKVGNFPTSKEANQMAVLTRSIKQLEVETSIAEIYEVATSFIDFIKTDNHELSKQLLPLFDAFIKNKL